MKLLLIDNNDSFTYNLRQALIGEHIESSQIKVIKYDEIQAHNLNTYDALVISPGPGHPSEYPDYFPILDRYHGHKKILGVCLGFQIMGLWRGMDVYQKQKIIHGIQVEAHTLIESEVLIGIPVSQPVGLYHSWAVNFLPDRGFQLLAEDEDRYPMIMQDGWTVGVQYHPESFLSPYGKILLKNWLKL